MYEQRTAIFSCVAYPVHFVSDTPAIKSIYFDFGIRTENMDKMFSTKVVFKARKRQHSKNSQGAKPKDCAKYEQAITLLPLPFPFSTHPSRFSSQGIFSCKTTNQLTCIYTPFSNLLRFRSFESSLKLVRQINSTGQCTFHI